MNRRVYNTYLNRLSSGGQALAMSARAFLLRDTRMTEARKAIPELRLTLVTQARSWNHAAIAHFRAARILQPDLVPRACH